MGVIVGAFLLYVVIIIIILMYYIDQYVFYRSIKKSLSSETLIAAGATSYGVYKTLFAIFGITTSIIMLAAASTVEDALELDRLPIAASVFPMAMSMFLTSTLNLLYAILAFGYKSHVQTATLNIMSYEQAKVQKDSHNPQQQYNPQPLYESTPAPTPQPYEQYRRIEEQPLSFDDCDPDMTLQSDKIHKAPVTDPAICPYCGKRGIGKAPFCGYCGNKVQ